MANVAAVRFASFFFGILALLFLIIAVPTHNWYTGDKDIPSNGTENVREIYGGIFEDCFLNGETYTCTTQLSDGYIKATKAFLVLSIVGFIVVTIYLLIMAFTRGICYKVLAALLVITGLFTLIGMCIYTDKHTIHNAKDWSFGWSFTLGWVSCVFTFIAGIFAFFGDASYEKI